jgi:mannose-6-phosphate isomerase-like protein (cupin superfamily)
MKRIKIYLLSLVGLIYSQLLLAQYPSLPDIDQEAPLDSVVTISREALVSAFRRFNAEDIAVGTRSTIRMLEGGEFNINIRHLKNISPENMTMLTHPDTIDLWIVQEGSGVAITGGEIVNGVHQGGEEQFISVGDMVFIPAGIPHGIKEASAITWFNIRFPEHRN